MARALKTPSYVDVCLGPCRGVDTLLSFVTFSHHHIIFHPYFHLEDFPVHSLYSRMSLRILVEVPRVSSTGIVLIDEVLFGKVGVEPDDVRIHERIGFFPRHVDSDAFVKKLEATFVCALPEGEQCIDKYKGAEYSSGYHRIFSHFSSFQMTSRIVAQDVNRFNPTLFGDERRR